MGDGIKASFGTYGCFAIGLPLSDQPEHVSLYRSDGLVFYPTLVQAETVLGELRRQFPDRPLRVYEVVGAKLVEVSRLGGE